jgi:hypothetical protein
MIAPPAQHRLLFHHDDKQNLVFVSNRIVIAGLAFLHCAVRATRPATLNRWRVSARYSAY